MRSSEQPLWAVTTEKVDEAVRRIVAVSHPIRIILFGSQARGEAGADSDVDLLVIERDVGDRYAEMVRLHETLRGLVLPVDILVVSEHEFEQWVDTAGSVYHAAQRDGKVLYEAA